MWPKISPRQSAGAELLQQVHDTLQRHGQPLQQLSLMTRFPKIRSPYFASTDDILVSKDGRFHLWFYSPTLLRLILHEISLTPFWIRFHSFFVTLTILHFSVSRSWVRNWSGRRSNVPNTGAWQPFCGGNLTCTCHLLASLCWDSSGWNHCRISSLHSHFRDGNWRRMEDNPHFYTFPEFSLHGRCCWRFFGCDFESRSNKSQKVNNFLVSEVW